MKNPNFCIQKVVLEEDFMSTYLLFYHVLLIINFFGKVEESCRSNYYNIFEKHVSQLGNFQVKMTVRGHSSLKRTCYINEKSEIL